MCGGRCGLLSNYFDHLEHVLHSEVVEDSNSAVPVVKLDGECVSTTHRLDDASDRCADSADTVDTKETTPDVHVIGNCDCIHLWSPGDWMSTILPHMVWP